MMFIVTGKDVETAAVTKDADAAFHLRDKLLSLGLNVYVNYIEEETEWNYQLSR